MNTEFTRKDQKLLSEAYTRVNEGILDRAGANIAGVVQGVKNVGTAAKAGYQAVTGNLQGAQQTIGGMKSGVDAKTASILKSSAKNFLTDLYKLKLIPNVSPNTPPSEQDITAFTNAVMPFIQQLKTTAAAPAATPAAAPAPIAPVGQPGTLGGTLQT
jgi:hypothetical protein